MMTSSDLLHGAEYLWHVRPHLPFFARLRWRCVREHL